MAKSYSAADYGLTEAEYLEAKRMAELSQHRSGQAGGIYYSVAPGQAQQNLAKEIEKIKARKGNAGTGGGSASGTQSNQSSFSGIEDQDVFNAIKGKLTGLIAGTDADALLAKQQKQESISGYDKLLADYSKQGAFTDAAALMQQNLNAAMEANKPAIQRAVEGSGTSAGSMQALLSQQLADKAALSAGALGAEQAKAYGQISANLMGGRGQLTTGKDDSISGIAQLGDLLKISRGSNISSSYGNFNPADMMNAEANMLRAQQSGQALAPTKTISSYGGPPLQDMVAGTGIAGGSGIQGFGGYASIAEYDAAEKKKRDAKDAAYRASLDAANAQYARYTTSGVPANSNQGGWTSYGAGGTQAAPGTGTLTNETTGAKYQFS